MNCHPPEAAGGTRTRPDTVFVPSPKKFRAEDPPEIKKRRRKSSNQRRGANVDPSGSGKSISKCKSKEKFEKNHDSDLTKKSQTLNEPKRRRQQRRGSTVASISVKEVALERKANEVSELTLRGCGGKDPEERIIKSIPRHAKTRDPLPLLAASSRRAARRASKSGRCRSSASSPVSDELPTTGAKTRKKTKKPKPKSILRNSTTSAPPPIRYFGGANSDGTDDVSSIEDSCSGITTVIDMSSSTSTEETSVRSVQSRSRSTNSALRRGKYATSNRRLAISGDECSFDGSDTDTNTEGFQFHREKSFFMRTADLGLTQVCKVRGTSVASKVCLMLVFIQDTVFAQQFMETSCSEPEPHYHQPSPHPPPGVQFNIDENWISIDDGNGGHSPISPQAVDALVSIGYKVASDPMM